MGINGLLPTLKSITQKVHVEAYRGEKVAVDAYCWLHKGVFGCAMELALGHPTKRFVQFCMSRVNLLRSFGVVPILVFDGDRLPMKKEEEALRSRQKNEYKRKAEAHMEAGNRAAARECYQRCTEVTPQMAKQLIDELKLQQVDFVVAPYEADAQMAYLAKQKEVSAVITEDSDLLAYGCPRVLFKLDKYGEGQEIQLKNLGQNQAPRFIGFTHQMFLEMCIMSGCDFLKSAHGIGVKKAHTQILKTKNFVKACKVFRLNGTSIPAGYEIGVQRTIWLFRHQRVFCKKARKVLHLTPLPEGGIGSSDVDVIDALPLKDDEQSLAFLGPDVPDEEANQIAVGLMDPISRELFDGNEPKNISTQGSQNSRPSWRSSGNQLQRVSGRSSGARRHLSVQTNSIARYLSPKEIDACGTRKAFVAPRSSQTKDQGDAASEVASTTTSNVIGAARKRLSSFACPGTKRPVTLDQRAHSNLSISDSSRKIADGFQTPKNSVVLCHDVQRIASIVTGTVQSTEIGVESELVGGFSKKLKCSPNMSTSGMEQDDYTASTPIASPVTPRSTSFFHQSDVSPDILGDDLEADIHIDFLGEKSLGSLRKEDNTFQMSRKDAKTQRLAKQAMLRMGLRKPIGKDGKTSQGSNCSQTSGTPSDTFENEELPLKEVNLTPEKIGCSLIIPTIDERSQICGMVTKTPRSLLRKENDFSSTFKSRQTTVDRRNVKHCKEMTESSGELSVETTENVVCKSSHGGFHGIEHVAEFAAVAQQTLDRLEGHRSAPVQLQMHAKDSRKKDSTLEERSRTKEVERSEIFTDFAFQG